MTVEHLKVGNMKKQSNKNLLNPIQHYVGKTSTSSFSSDLSTSAKCDSLSSIVANNQIVVNGSYYFESKIIKVD